MGIDIEQILYLNFNNCKWKSTIRTIRYHFISYFFLSALVIYGKLIFIKNVNTSLTNICQKAEPMKFNENCLKFWNFLSLAFSLCMYILLPRTTDYDRFLALLFNFFLNLSDVCQGSSDQLLWIDDVKRWINPYASILHF